MSIRELALPGRLARRLDRALDAALRQPGRNSRGLRLASTDAAAVLMVQGGSPEAVVRQLSDLVAAHAEERGFRASSVLILGPAYAIVALDVRDWVTAALPSTAPASPGAPASVVNAHVRRWEQRAHAPRVGGHRTA